MTVNSIELACSRQLSAQTHTCHTHTSLDTSAHQVSAIMEEMADQQFKQMLLAYMILVLKDRPIKVCAQAFGACCQLLRPPGSCPAQLNACQWLLQHSSMLAPPCQNCRAIAPLRSCKSPPYCPCPQVEELDNACEDFLVKDFAHRIDFQVGRCAVGRPSGRYRGCCLQAPRPWAMC